ncbi:hypothetical protein [Rickettsia rhipicephali]|uniref:hypothetical protein n=1 Tax=Rickettsia rhipicephali TaxID=33992 RepID=UPI00396A202F
MPQGANFYDVFGQREASNIGKLINEALEQIEKENSAKLGEVFRVDFNSEYNLGKIKERNCCLKMLLEDFNKPELDLSPDRVSVDIIGECYIYLTLCFRCGHKSRRILYSCCRINFTCQACCSGVRQYNL